MPRNIAEFFNIWRTQNFQHFQVIEFVDRLVSVGEWRVRPLVTLVRGVYEALFFSQAFFTRDSILLFSKTEDV